MRPTRTPRAGPTPEVGSGGPVRRCVGCRRRAPAAELVRVSVRDGVWALGPGAGRGAWLCPSSACLARATRGRTLCVALRLPAVPDPARLAATGAFPDRSASPPPSPV